MKRIMTLLATLAVALALPACDGDKPKEQKIDPYAKLSINVKDGKNTRASWEGENPDLPHNEAHLSPQELVKAVAHIVFVGKSGQYEEMSVMPDMKDIENAKIKLPSNHVINVPGSIGDPYLEDEFLLATDVRLYGEGGFGKEERIIGYIPTKVLREGWKVIKPAWDRGDVDEVYRLFQECYVAYPCTLEEWKDLKAKGLN